MDRIGKVGDTTVYADRDSVEVARAYIKAHRGGARTGEPTKADAKAAAAFADRYAIHMVRHGFAGSGEWVYEDRIDGGSYEVIARANGRNFWGTDVMIRARIAINTKGL